MSSASTDGVSYGAPYTHRVETYLAHELALHEDAHGHVKAEELPLHLELQVVLRCFPLLDTHRDSKRPGIQGRSIEKGGGEWSVQADITESADVRSPDDPSQRRSS